MSADWLRDYEVGYGKPPIGRRFEKGKSGNPRGRPRRPKDLASLLTRALDTPMVVIEEGTRRKLTKREIVIAQFVEKCVGADLRATKLLLDMLQKLERGVPAAPGDTRSSASDDDVYAQVRAKLARLALARGIELPGAERSESADAAQPHAKEPATPSETQSSASDDDVYAQLRAKLARLALAQGAELPGTEPSECPDAAQPCSIEDEG
jgi:hypothetical protein